MMAKSFQNCERSFTRLLRSPVKDFDRETFWVSSGLHHDRRYGTDKARCGHPLRAVASDVARDFASAVGMADECYVIEIERFNDRRQIVSVSIHIVPGPSLGRAAMAAAIVRDHAESVLGKKKHLAVP